MCYWTMQNCKEQQQSQPLSDAELIKQSDLVVRCTFKGEKETKEQIQVAGKTGRSPEKPAGNATKEKVGLIQSEHFNFFRY